MPGSFPSCLLRSVCWILLLSAATLTATGAGIVVTVAPPVTAVERPGITGAGWATVDGDGIPRRVTLIYPNHPDDFGGSAGTGTSISTDGGATWTPGTDDHPIARSVDLWQDRLADGTRVALGIRRLPDPKLRAYDDPATAPADAYALATARGGDNDWTLENAVLQCPPELGVVARPLPHIFTDAQGAWLMPAYAWSKTGNRGLLLQSEDRGRNWSVRSTVFAAAEVVRQGVPVTTPWLETAVARTSDGALLAVMRTGSSDQAALVIARSNDDGRSWTAAEKLLVGPDRLPVAGKLPNLALLANGALVLSTAHTKIGCLLFVSSDGTGRDWSDAQVVTKTSGGNTSLLPLDAETLLVFTPAPRRISCHRVTVRR